jgi:DNA-directed RNA polymerase specialized sigma24 family protein
MWCNLSDRAGVYGDTETGERTEVADQEFDASVVASGPHWKRLAFLLTGDLDAAEDLLQAACAKALPRWSRIRSYDEPDANLRRRERSTPR